MLKKVFKFAGMVVVVGGLVGCASTGEKLASDAQNAAALNPANAACYKEFGALGTVQMNATGASGPLTLTALKMQLQSVVESPACAAPVMAILVELLKLGVPGAAIILP
jgi:hypothetical protein